MGDERDEFSSHASSKFAQVSAFGAATVLPAKPNPKLNANNADLNFNLFIVTISFDLI